MAGNENALRKMLSKSYKYRDLAMREITNVINQFKDLKPVMDIYVFNDGSNRELMSLTGTVPVSFKGNVYNIPICLWLLDTYPYNPPICFVKPTSAMMIKTGKHVDANGKIYLTYLHEWKHPQSDLFGLIQVMIVVFGEDPPVFARPTTQTALTAYPAFQPAGPPNDDPPRAETLTRRLGEMIVRDLQPLSIVEDEGFQGFVRALDPSYKLPSRKQLAETHFVNMFIECKGKVRETLLNAPSVVLTTDMWTSVSTELYLTVTSHVIQNWQMREFVLETHSFHGQPTADNISSELKRITAEWGITEKVVAVVTDHGTNMVAAVHKAGWRHYPCFAHTLNLVVQDSLKAVPEVVQLVEKCSTIVSFFHHDIKATVKLRAVQQQLKVAEHKLIQSVATRWKSAFYMLERLYEQNEAVTTALCFLEMSELCLDSGELSLINQTLDALRPFIEVTQEVSSEKHVSVSNMIPLVSLLHGAVAACEHQGNSLATQLAQQCQHRFRATEIIHGLAASTFLDVRFKHLGFRDKDNVEAIKKLLLTEMQEVYQSVESAPILTPGSNLAPSASCTSVPMISSTSVPSSESPALASGSAATKRGLWTDFDMHVLSGQNQQSAATDVLTEMCCYLEEKLIPRDKDPLLWWQEHEHTFPALSRLAVKYLGIVATSVPAERIFSKAGEVVSKKRSRLNGKTVNMLLFLNKNL